MEVMAVFYGVCAFIACGLWIFTETKKGKEWIKNL